MEKKRILVFLIFGVFLAVYFGVNVNACHDGTPDECAPGQSEFGGNCGTCSTMRRDCDSSGTWGGWFCENNAPPNFGQSCTCSGTIDCAGSCVNQNLSECTPCEQDCTFASDNIIHASCDTRNGCTFYDNTSMAVCDNSQPGWVRDYNESHYVECAPGAPQPKVEIQASISCESGTLVKVTRIVLYNGEPVKLVVAACG